MRYRACDAQLFKALHCTAQVGICRRRLNLTVDKYARLTYGVNRVGGVWSWVWDCMRIWRWG